MVALMARHLGRHIPGNPTLVMRNMPGAGGSTAATYLYKSAPQDGTIIGAVAPNAILGRLFDDSQSQYDPAKFQYLAGAERGTRLCMTFAHSKVKTFADALKARAVIGATSAGSPTREYAAMIRHATGAKFEIVSGYRGPPELFLAMARGEIDGVCGLDWAALKSQQPEWLRDGKLNLLVQAAIEPEPELVARRCAAVWPYITQDTDSRAVELMVGLPAGFRQILSRAVRECPPNACGPCATRLQLCCGTRSFLPRPTSFASRSRRRAARMCSAWWRALTQRRPPWSRASGGSSSRSCSALVAGAHALRQHARLLALAHERQEQRHDRHHPDRIGEPRREQDGGDGKLDRNRVTLPWPIRIERRK